VFNDGDSRGIVTAIFQSVKAVHYYRCGLFISDITDNPTHISSSAFYSGRFSLVERMCSIHSILCGGTRLDIIAEKAPFGHSSFDIVRSLCTSFWGTGAPGRN
jgi:hypothetical protein